MSTKIGFKMFRFLILFLLIGILFVANTDITYASWTSNLDSDIYNENLQGREIGEENSQEDRGSDNIVIIWIYDLVLFIAEALNSLLEYVGVTLDSVIYGRVGSGDSSSVAMFTFELKPDNPYGVVATSIYSLFRKISYLFMACFIIFKLGSYVMFKKGSPEAWNDLKEMAGNLVVLFLLLEVMPKILDLFLYIRDLILYVVLTGGSKLVLDTDEPLSLIDTFYALATEYEGDIMNALMYLGAVCITVYFSFAYTSAAVSLVIMFIMFTIVTVQSQSDKNALSGWCKNMFGTLIIPWIDSSLFLIPLFIGSTGLRGASYIQLIVCMCIIPARAVVRSQLGLGGSMGMEMMGMGSMFAAGMMVKSGISGIKNAIGKGKGAYDDYKSGKREEELAGLEEQQDKEYEEDYNNYASMGDGINTEQNAGPEDSMDWEYGTTDVSIDGESVSGGGTVEGASYGGNGSSGTRGDRYGEAVNHFANRSGASSNVFDDRGALRQESVNQMSNDRDTLKKQNSGFNMQKSQLKSRRAEINLENRALQEKMDTDSLNPIELSEAKSTMAHNNVQIAGIDRESAYIDERIAENNHNISNIDSQLSEVKAMGGSSNGGSSSGGYSRGQIDPREREIMKKYANIKNFESPEFSNALSHADKAKLYKQRAIKNAISSAGSVAGGMTGATVGVGASMFMGTTGKAMFIGGGAMVGAKIGETTASFAEAGARGVGNVVDRSASRMADAQIIEAAMNYNMGNPGGSDSSPYYPSHGSASSGGNNVPYDPTGGAGSRYMDSVNNTNNTAVVPATQNGAKGNNDNNEADNLNTLDITRSIDELDNNDKNS